MCYNTVIFIKSLYFLSEYIIIGQLTDKACVVIVQIEQKRGGVCYEYFEIYTEIHAGN